MPPSSGTASIGKEVSSSTRSSGSSKNRCRISRPISASLPSTAWMRSPERKDSSSSGPTFVGSVTATISTLFTRSAPIGTIPWSSDQNRIDEADGLPIDLDRPHVEPRDAGDLRQGVVQRALLDPPVVDQDLPEPDAGSRLDALGVLQPLR